MSGQLSEGNVRIVNVLSIMNKFKPFSAEKL